MTPIEIFLAIIAAQLGFICLFLVVFIGMEVMNGMYVRKCYAEAQKKQAEQAANPLAALGITLQPGQAGQQQLAGAVAAAEGLVPCETKECEGSCDACKATEKGGNYL